MENIQEANEIVPRIEKSANIQISGGQWFSVENPEASLMWETKPMRALKRMMGIITYAVGDQSKVHDSKKKEAQELKDVWDSMATKKEKIDMLAKFTAMGIDGVKARERLKGILEFRHGLKGGKLEEVKVEENFHTRRVLPLSTHI